MECLLLVSRGGSVSKDEMERVLVGTKIKRSVFCRCPDAGVLVEWDEEQCYRVWRWKGCW